MILEVVVQDQLRLGRAPDWAREILWAPFMAMAYLMLLRWMLDGEPPARAINFEVERKTRHGAERRPDAGTSCGPARSAPTAAAATPTASSRRR